MATYGFDENKNKVEVYSKSEATPKAETGNLSSLRTSAKSSIVDALNEVFQNANDGKAKLATAIGEGANAYMTWDQLGERTMKFVTYFRGQHYNETRSKQGDLYFTEARINLPFKPKLVVGIGIGKGGYQKLALCADDIITSEGNAFDVSMIVSKDTNKKEAYIAMYSPSQYYSSDRIYAIGNEIGI